MKSYFLEKTDIENIIVSNKYKLLVLFQSK